MYFGFRYHWGVMNRMAILGLTVLTLAGGLCFVGCETESASENNVDITPASATILIDESVTLTASGGYDYEWSLENDSWGTLSTTEGSTTTYTSAYDPDADTWQEHQVVTVRSYLNKAVAKADSTNGTSDINNFTDYQQTAEAIITHQTKQPPITISPALGSVSNRGDSVTFTASGANTYSWSLQHKDWGLLSTRTGPTTTYTSMRTEPVDGEDDVQVLTCVTDRGTTSAHIVHQTQD